MAADAGAAPRPVPRAADLESMPADQWALFLRHVRAVLHEIDDNLLSPRLQQLRATPPGRLAGGRLRAELCRGVAVSGPVWTALAERIAGDPHLASAGWLTNGGPAPGPVVAAPAPTKPSRDDAAAARREERHKQLRTERDAALRRAEGLEARLRTSEQRAHELERELEGARAREQVLEQRLASASAEREQTVERARRQADAESAALRDQVRELRRSAQHREADEQRRRRAAADADDRGRAEVDAYRAATASSQRVAVAGRPSKLPAGISPGTDAAARALVTTDRLVLIDGYNVTKQHRSQLDLEAQRRWLVSEAEAIATITGCRPAIVFDGRGDVVGPPPVSKLVRVRYTSGGTADDEIVRWVRALPRDESVIVVTDDREIVDRVGAMGADVVGTRALLSLTARAR